MDEKNPILSRILGFFGGNRRSDQEKSTDFSQFARNISLPNPFFNDGEPKKQELVSPLAYMPTPKPTSSPTPTPQPTPRPEQQRPQTADYLEQQVFPVTRQFGIPDAVAAAQWAAEGRGQHRFGQAPYNNPFNINAIDSNPSAATQYQDPIEGVRAYAELLQGRYGDALKQEDVVSILEAIQNMGYAGDPTTYSQRSDSGFDSYSDFARNTPEFRYFNY